MVTHSSTKNNESWEDVQDAAVKDLECAIAFSSMTGEASFVTLSGESKEKSPIGEEEEEIAPPADIKDEKKDEKQENDNKADGSQHECSECNKSFANISLLQRHMKLHSAFKPFICNVCGARFLQKYNLNKHMIIHESTKPNKSIELKAVFPDKNQLRYTQKSDEQDHTSNSPPIKILPKATARKSQSSSHGSNFIHTSSTPSLPIALHTASKNTAIPNEKILNSEIKSDGPMFPCTNCEKTFAVRAELDKHLPFHRKLEKPYSCVVCGWRFHLLNNMQRHMMTHTALDKTK